MSRGRGGGVARAGREGTGACTRQRIAWCWSQKLALRRQRSDLQVGSGSQKLGEFEGLITVEHFKTQMVVEKTLQKSPNLNQ